MFAKMRKCENAKMASVWGPFSLEGYVNPRSFVDEFCVRQVVADVRQPAGVHRYVNSSAFGVIGVSRAPYGLVEGLAAETAVDFNRYAKMFAQRLQDLGAQTYEIVHFDRVNAVLYLLLLSGVAVKHFFQSKVFS